MELIKTDAFVLADHPVFKTIAALLEDYLLTHIERADEVGDPLSFQFSVRLGRANGFGIRVASTDKPVSYNLGEQHRVLFEVVNNALQAWDGREFHQLKMLRERPNRWQVTLGVDFKVLQYDEHERLVERQMAKRRKWFCDFTGLSVVQTFDLRPQGMPFPMGPMWPSHRFGFFLGFTKHYTWILSNGLSNPIHPSNDEQWKALSNCLNCELLSRMPKDALENTSNVGAVVKNKFVETFLGMAGTVALLDGPTFSHGAKHLALGIEYDKYTSIPPTRDDTVMFLSSAQSLRAAETIAQPDGQFPNVDVRFATLLSSSDGPELDDEQQSFSQRLLREDRIGYLDPAHLSGADSSLTI